MRRIIKMMPNMKQLTANSQDSPLWFMITTHFPVFCETLTLLAHFNKNRTCSVIIMRGVNYFDSKTLNS
jgi:hypothetical protein